MASTKKTEALTELPPADYISYGELLLTGLPCYKAAAEVWPELKKPGVRATRANKDPRFKVWMSAQKELNQQAIRQITTALGADYESRIIALAEAFNDSNVKMRERLQIHDKLTVAEGRKVSRPEEGKLDTNRLAQLVTGAAAFGAAAGPRLLDGRLPVVCGELPVDTDERGRTPEVQVVAAPGPDVARPGRADTEQ